MSARSRRISRMSRPISLAEAVDAPVSRRAAVAEAISAGYRMVGTPCRLPMTMQGSLSRHEPTRNAAVIFCSWFSSLERLDCVGRYCRSLARLYGPASAAYFELRRDAQPMGLCELNLIALAREPLLSRPFRFH